MKKVSKHPMKKSELDRLKPIIQEKLIMKGVSNRAMREIANELGIDAGLVVKIKQRTDSNFYRKEPVPVATETSIQAVAMPVLTEAIPVPELDTKEEKEKELTLNERKRLQLDKVREKAITAKKHFLTAEEKEKLIRDYKSGKYSQQKLADMYEICTGTVGNILKKAKMKEGEGMKRKGKITTKRNRNNKKQQPIIPKSNPNTSIVTTTTTAENTEIYAVVKFVTDIPVYEKDLINKKNIIWALSKNRDISDLGADLHINSKNDMRRINDLRGRYYLVSFSNNKLQLIDFFDETNKEIIPYAQETSILYENEDGIISNSQIVEAIKIILKYDKSIERSRLRLGDFVLDPSKFTNLQRIFGLDKFSFNLASKNNSVTVEAGLVADRHNMPVGRFIYPEALSQDLMFNYSEQERIAQDFLKANFDFDPDSNDKRIKVLKLYITGMQCAFAAVMKVCTEMGVNLVAMHYNSATGGYVPQYIVGQVEETGAYVKGFDRILSQKSLNGDILLFNCTYEDFSETNIDNFYILEAAKMRNTSSTDNQKDESIIIVIKKREDIWKIYPTVLDHIIDNDGLNLAVWVTTARIKDNNLYWGMNIIKSFNYK